MKKIILMLSLASLTINSAAAQSKKQDQMEKTIINPWKWQDERGYVQAVEVKNVSGTLYVSGQTATDADGRSSTGDMKSQLDLTLQNLEKVIGQAGYECKNIVKLNIYTTSSEELFPNLGILNEWAVKHEMRQTTTLLEVKSLYETLKVELEATVVK